MKNTQEVDRANTVRQAQAIKERNQKLINELLEWGSPGEYVELLLDLFQKIHDKKDYARIDRLTRSNDLFKVRRLCTFVSSVETIKEEEVANG